MKSSFSTHFSRGASWILIIYLSLVIPGCSFRPAELSPEEARLLQTRDFNHSPEKVAKAASIVLQEMHYTLGNVDMGLGIITASRSSEHSLAPISREGSTESDLGTFCVVAGAVAVVTLFLVWMFDAFDSDDEDESSSSGNDHSHHHDHGSDINIFGSSGSSISEADSYTYNLTINLEERSLEQTRLRLTIQGEHYEGPTLVETGPVQDQQFYDDFYFRLQALLGP